MGGLAASLGSSYQLAGYDRALGGSVEEEADKDPAFCDSLP